MWVRGRLGCTSVGTPLKRVCGSAPALSRAARRRERALSRSSRRRSAGARSGALACCRCPVALASCRRSDALASCRGSGALACRRSDGARCSACCGSAAPLASAATRACSWVIMSTDFWLARTPIRFASCCSSRRVSAERSAGKSALARGGSPSAATGTPALAGGASPPLSTRPWAAAAIRRSIVAIPEVAFEAFEVIPDRNTQHAAH